MKLRCLLLSTTVMLLFTGVISANDSKQKPLTDEEKARGTAMLDTFASEFMPQTNVRYKQVTQKFELQRKTLSDLDKTIRENGGVPDENDTFKVIQAKCVDQLNQIYDIRDELFGSYCYHKMDVFTSDELLERDKLVVARLAAKYDKKQ